MEYGTDHALAAAYLPRLFYDKAEPFSLQGIGYTVYRSTAQSPSCRRVIEAPEKGVAIEYAFYFDFDIQHLYDLEHSFVYLNEEGTVTGVESSFHGWFLNSMIEQVLRFEDGHPVLHVQPGKHALLPSPDYFKLLLDRNTVCRETAGKDGFLIMPMFEDRLSTDPETDRRVETFIREKYAFTPSWEFGPESPNGGQAETLLMPWQELDRRIVERLSVWKDAINRCNFDRI